MTNNRNKVQLAPSILGDEAALEAAHEAIADEVKLLSQEQIKDELSDIGVIGTHIAADLDGLERRARRKRNELEKIRKLKNSLDTAIWTADRAVGKARSAPSTKKGEKPVIGQGGDDGSNKGGCNVATVRPVQRRRSRRNKQETSPCE